MTLNRFISTESVPFLMKLILENADRSQNLLNRTTKEKDPNDHPANEDCQHQLSAIGSDGQDDSMETVISTVFGTYLTLKHLDSKVLDELNRVGGRIAVSDLNILLGVDEPGAIEACLVRLGTFQTKDQAMTESYMTRKVMEISSNLNASRGGGGSVSVTDVALQWDLPAESVLQILIQPGRLPPTVHLLTQENGSKSLVSDAFLRHLQSSFFGVLLGASAPSNISKLCRERQWDPTWVVKLILPRLVDVLPGDVHGDCYVPHIHTKQQRHAVEEFFRANGFITSDHGHKLGVLPSTLKQYVLQAFPAVLTLNNWLVDRDRLIPPLEALVQEALDSGSWVDLTLHIPPELLADESNCRTLLFDFVLSNDVSNGVVAITCDTALFMSEAMVQSIMKDTVFPMIEPWSKRRALELLKSEGDESTLSSATLYAAKKKRSAKKTVPLPPSSDCTDDPPPILPLDDIVSAVVAAHNELAELHSESIEKDCALVQLCEKAFHSSDLFISTCKHDLDAEVLRLEEERAARVSISHRESAAKERNIQVNFEDPSCFAAFCDLIQGFSTFVEYASSADVQVVTEQESKDLKRDFLLGCGAEFSRRVSLFCLFKNDADNQCFSFEPTEALSTPELLHFCSPVPAACRKFPWVFLSSRKEDDPKAQGPLAKLRNILPATVGTALARQWVLCGAESYQCGTKPGDYEGFLKHIEEHCLTICGLPFKSFDKKAKKQFLNARRQQLVQALECETDPAACLDLAIMLLFQLVKNHIVFGSLLNGPIVRLLCHEKKISDDVAQALLHASGQVATGGTVETDVMERLKRLALGWK